MENEALRAYGPPLVGNGGILPGPSTAAGGAGLDYAAHSLIPALVNGFLIILIMITVLAIIVGGVMLIVGSGDSEETQRGKDVLLWSILGLCLAILSYTIVNFIFGLFAPGSTIIGA